jgi:hypothetical protein
MKDLLDMLEVGIMDYGKAAFLRGPKCNVPKTLQAAIHAVGNQQLELERLRFESEFIGEHMSGDESLRLAVIALKQLQENQSN